MSGLREQVRAIRTRVGIGRRDGKLLRADTATGRSVLGPRLATSLELREAQFRQALRLDDAGRPVVDLLVGTFRGTMLALADDPEGWLDASPETAAMRAEDVAVIGVDGPFAWEVIGAWSSPSAIGLPYLGAFSPREGVLVVRAGRTGEYGYLVLVPADRAEAEQEALWRCAAPMDPVAVGSEAIAHCALENWVFEQGREGRAGLDALELQLTWRLDLHKDAPGLDAIRAHRASGLRRRLTAVDAPGPTRAGAVVTHQGRRIGEVVARAPRLDAPGDSALAVLDLPFANPGMSYEADGAPVRTRSAPFVTNLSLFVNPQRHAWATRDEIELPPGLSGVVPPPRGPASDDRVSRAPPSELRWPTTGRS